MLTCQELTDEFDSTVRKVNCLHAAASTVALHLKQCSWSFDHDMSHL